MASENVDLAKTLIQVKATLIEGAPANFRSLELNTCANCKHVAALNYFDDGTCDTIQGCLKNGCTFIDANIDYRTTCDDWANNG